MSTYAIIKTGGKQVKVEVGQAIYVEKINAEAGSEVTFNEVVLVGGDKTVVGTPVVEGATVVGTIEKQGKQKKVVTFKQIVSLFKEILDRPQQNADLAMLCAQYMITKHMEKESVPVLNQVLSLDPENKPARLQLLSYAIRDNNLDEVIRVATPALEYNPDAMEFYYYLGLAHYQKEETDKAMEIFQQGLKQVNEKSDKGIVSDFYAILGDLYHSKEMKAEAYAAYDSSLVYNPNNIGTLNNYAYYLSVERTNLDKAEEMSYKTVKAEPENATYLDTYAWILFEKKRYTEARIYIEQAMKNGGDSSQVIVEHCGDIYYMSGEKEKALEYWKKADSMENKEEDGATPRTEAELKRLKRKIALKKYIE